MNSHPPGKSEGSKKGTRVAVCIEH